MSIGWTGLPELERVALDADIRAEVGDYLAAVGFDVARANQSDVDVRSDLAVLRWARRENRFLLCHDKHRDRGTLLPLLREIIERGGQIIRIGGAPGQSPLTSTGLVLAHRARWQPFFAEHANGVALVHLSGCQLRPPAALRRLLQQRGG